MKKYLSLVLILAVLGAVGFFAFREPEKKTAEVNAWSVPAENGSISAQFIDDSNHVYMLALTGSGRLSDFEKPEDAPWYSRSGRVSAIEIDGRITAIGKNAFPAWKLFCQGENTHFSENCLSFITISGKIVLPGFFM